VIKSFFQTSSWAQFKRTAGWQPIKLGESYLLRRKLPLGRSLDYAPELPYSDNILGLVQEFCRTTQPTIFSRFEFLEVWDEQKASRLKALGLVKSFEEVQPEHRQWVELHQEEQAILDQMKPKGRYNISIAKRNFLTVEHRSDDEAAQIFFELYQQTSQRQQFKGRGLVYFTELVRLLKTENAGEVIIIYKDNQPLSAGIFLYWQEMASYLYGASSQENRQLMAPYLMHWEAITSAKSKGCRIYDLLAIAPEGAENHPYSSLTRFKTQFGGRRVRLLGSWDFIRSPFWYTMYQFVERRRRGAL